MLTADIESRTKRMRLAFNLTLVYIALAMLWFILGQELRTNLLGLFNIKELTSSTIYIINLLLSSCIMFFMMCMILKRFHRDETIINDNLAQLEEKELTIEQVSLDIESQNQLISDVLESAAVVIIRLDKDFNILRISKNIKTIADFEKDQIKGKSINELISRDDFDILEKNISKRDKLAKDLKLRTSSGKTIHMHGTLKKNRDNSKNGSYYTLVLCDISERKVLEEKVNYLNSYDIITALPNRSLLEKAFKAILPKVRERGNPVALLYIDIDDFAYINETLGHHAGDHLLMDMANLLKIFTKETDLISRITQDKFIVIFTEEETLADIDKRVVQILKDTRIKWEYENHKYLISNTIGIALYPSNGQDFVELLKHANMALEYAKETARTSYEYYSKENKADTVNDLTIVSDIKIALDNKDFQMHYQPIRNLETGELENVESLIRWFHPEKGYISPADFIPVAERAGIIDEIGNYTLDEVFSQKKRWNDSGYKLKKVSINISAVSFSKVGFSKEIRGKLDQYGLDGHEIVLELTETIFSTHRVKIKKNIEDVRSWGIEVAMDDFGTGYSSLARLKDLPIDYVKLDREFIMGLLEQDGKEIIKPLISLANALGKKVIAEGIETEEQFRILREQGCTFGQGYYLARPMSALDLEAH
nr:EAL domain-containing protein [Tissierella sp.]